MNRLMEYILLVACWIVGISFLWTFRYEWIGLFFTIVLFAGIVAFGVAQLFQSATSPSQPLWQIGFFFGLAGTILVQIITASYLGLFFTYIWNTFHRRATFTEFTHGLYNQWKTVKIAWTMNGFFTLALIGVLFGIMFPSTATDPLFPKSTLFQTNPNPLLGLAVALVVGSILSSSIGLGYMIPLYKARYNIQPKRETGTHSGKIKPIHPYDELMRRNTMSQLSNYSFR